MASVVAAAMLLPAFAVAADRSASEDRMAWLVGAWVSETEGGTTTESWRRVSDNTMEGVAYVTTGDSTRVSEYLRIERFGDDIFYIAKPGQNEFPTAFRLVSAGEKRLVFENPNHDFPQRIIYTLTSETSLSVRIESLADGENRGRSFVFERKD